jgi:isopentenyl diphosphate isomerase/L-lactate dehydrogenase-like FMN-dependent dehydrogenase
VLSLLEQEIDRSLALLGCRNIASLGPDHLVFTDANQG